MKKAPNEDFGPWMVVQCEQRFKKGKMPLIGVDGKLKG